MELHPAAAVHSRPARGVVELTLFALAFLVNVSSFSAVFVDGQVSFPTGSDELYHMRRVWYEAVHFPVQLDFDPYVNFPDGARPVWPFLFDWLVAGVARLLVGSGDQGAVERLVAWIPPLLGAANVVAVSRLASALFGRRTGLLAGSLLALLPAHAFNARLAMLDHHVAVSLATTLLMSCGVKSFSVRRRPHVAAAAGLAIAVGLLLWPGFLLQALVFQAVAIGRILLCANRATAIARAHMLALTLGLAAAALTPFCAGQRWEDLGLFSPLVLSWFQPVWFGAGTALLALSAALWGGEWTGATRARRFASALALALVGLAAALASLDGLLEAVLDAGGWFSKQGDFLVTVEELKPLLWPQGPFDPRLAHQEFSLFFWTFPVAWLWLAWKRGRGEDAAQIWLVLVWSGSFLAATLAQMRFFDLFATSFVLVLAAPFEAVVARLGRIGGRRSRIAASLGLAAAALLGLLPCAAYHRNPRALSLAGSGRETIDEAALWLRRNTPPTRGYLDASQRPEYGVLAEWGDGHRIRYRAERPVVQDNFGVYAGRKNYALAGAYYRTSEEEGAYEIARNLGVRYVVGTRRGSGHGAVPIGSMTYRLSMLLGSASPAGDIPALGRHRLVFLAGAGRSRVALFEVVPGAQVTGVAPPGQELSFELHLRTEAGDSRLYRATARASSGGRYELRLPYSTETPAHSSVAGVGNYQVRCGNLAAEFALSEDDVQEGRAAVGPSC